VRRPIQFDATVSDHEAKEGLPDTLYFRSLQSLKERSEAPQPTFEPLTEQGKIESQIVTLIRNGEPVMCLSLGGETSFLTNPLTNEEEVALSRLFIRLHSIYLFPDDKESQTACGIAVADSAMREQLSKIDVSWGLMAYPSMREDISLCFDNWALGYGRDIERRFNNKGAFFTLSGLWDTGFVDPSDEKYTPLMEGLESLRQGDEEGDEKE
jgi:hypothetical protein